MSKRRNRLSQKVIIFEILPTVGVNLEGPVLDITGKNEPVTNGIFRMGCTLKNGEKRFSRS